jgi:hypothetical protein
VAVAADDGRGRLTRWACPGCRQVVGIDRDPQVGGRFQVALGQPWSYAVEAFRR